MYRIFVQIIPNQTKPLAMLNKLYRHNLTLLTDLYQLTMAHGYREAKMHNREAVFHLFFRKNPFGGDYAVAAGLELAVDYLKQLKFDVSDIQYLGGIKGNNEEPLFSESFLNFLQRFEFQCDIDAVPEGTIVFPHQPLVRVQGPLWQCQIIETALLNILNFSTLIATKSARITAAAQGEPVLEFGLRRAQGIDGGLTGSRAAYIGGCHATSNVLAGKLCGIPVKGTHAHSWVMSFDNELESFLAYAKAMPTNSTLLVDTYNTVEGVKNAVIVGKKLRGEGYEMNGIRLDSGDLAELSKKARVILDEGGFPNAHIVASNDLDEYRIKELKERGAKITVWGIGTRLMTAYDQPALGGVYKLAALKGQDADDQPVEAWDYKIKLSEQIIKTSNPGRLGVRRMFKNGIPQADIIYDADLRDDKKFILKDFKTDKEITFNFADGEDLLQPIFQKGKYIGKEETIHKKRERTLAQIALFAKTDITNYKVGLEHNVWQKKQQLMQLRSS